MNITEFYRDKVVLITGASMGIGKELAKQVLECGGKAVLTGRNEARLMAVQKAFVLHADRMLFYAGDVCSYEDNDLLMKQIQQHFGRLHIIINNAGMSAYGALDVLQPEVAKQVIDTNIYGSLYPVMAGLRHFKSSLHAILFVSSIAGFYGLPAYSAYSLSKRSLQALAQSLRIELQAQKIFVGITHVGFTENDEQKRTLSPTGALESIPVRPKKLVNSKTVTARNILLQIKQRKPLKTLSLFGKFMFFLAKFFPSLLHILLKTKYRKESGMIENG